MAVYKCSVCGYIFDEEKEGKSFDTLEVCPVCGQPKDVFEKLEVGEEEGSNLAEENEEIAVEAVEAGIKMAADEAEKSDNTNNELGYDSRYKRRDESIRYISEIHEMAVRGDSIHASMGIKNVKPDWDDILILGAQLNPPPLNDEDHVSTMTVIGKNAKRPMIIKSPVYVSHMSFGALSKEAKIALAKGSAAAGTAMCSGEGGILEEEKEAAYKYIFEYVPNLYSVNDENLRSSDAIEIKIGQGTKPGMGGHLP